MVVVKLWLGGSSIGIIIQQLHICPSVDMAMSSTMPYKETLFIIYHSAYLLSFINELPDNVLAT